MILVLSRRRGDETTEQVCDWLAHLGARFFRLNAEDLAYPSPFAFDPATRVLHVDGVELRLAEVRVVWYRRWTSFEAYVAEHVDRFFDDVYRQHEVTQYLGHELSAAGQAVLGALRHARWLSDPVSARLDKTRVLMAAADVGLEVPPTLVATTREACLAFVRQHGEVITKSLAGRALLLPLDGSAVQAYTAVVSADEVAATPAVFFPSLLQARVAKAFEIRAFVLGDRVSSMAIFSQSDHQTEVDFRRYDDARPSRCVPYQLPVEIACRLLALTRTLGLDTGSADLVRTPDGRHVFLEINPTGQFGMTSIPCNYHLEKQVATYLVSHDHP